MQKILLSGGTGLLGSHLVQFLKSRRYETSILSRKGEREGSGFFHWDPAQRKIDIQAFEGCSAIIHLAGAGIADKRWTDQRKKEILESRVKSTDLLFETLRINAHTIDTIVSASAIGIYGDGGEEWKHEKSEIDNGFLQDTCTAWEKAVLRFEDLGIRVVILRIGIVLAKDGGALPQMALPVKLFVGAPLGSGRQFISWIHIDDLCRIFLHTFEQKEMRGIFNAVSSNPVTNKEFYKVLAGNLHRSIWEFNVPAAVLKFILGERSEIVLNGQRVSNQKLITTGFDFNYKNLNKAISSLTV